MARVGARAVGKELGRCRTTDRGARVLDGRWWWWTYGTTLVLGHNHVLGLATFGQGTDNHTARVSLAHADATTIIGGLVFEGLTRWAHGYHVAGIDLLLGTGHL